MLLSIYLYLRFYKYKSKKITEVNTCLNLHIKTLYSCTKCVQSKQYRHENDVDLDTSSLTLST